MILTATKDFVDLNRAALGNDGAKNRQVYVVCRIRNKIVLIESTF